MALTVADAFKEFKARLELGKSLQNAVTTHHNAIRDWVESYDSKIETKLIGSLQRKTRIQPRSKDTFDIDVLVIFANATGWAKSGGVTPATALARLESVVRDHGIYEKLGPETDSPVIVFKYADNIKVELVPAWRDFVGDKVPKGRGYWIPRSNRWVLADYDYDADYISRANEKCNEYLIPTIKMLKAAKRTWFPDLSSYHLEIIASELLPGFVNYCEGEEIAISYPQFVYYFFLFAKEPLLAGKGIPESKSSPFQGYLKDDRKKEISGLFEKIAKYCEVTFRVDDRQAVLRWKKIFGEPFPTGE